MKLTASWLSHPGTMALMAKFKSGGHAAYFVGGCVRNGLLNLPTSDIDVSTDATPQTVTTLAEAAGFKTIPTGIDHGTVTVIADGLPHEITTFRKDVATDGRRAVVAFSNQIEDDARRRDFTMNALYADLDGHVLDPLGQGITDLKAQRLRFIEDPSERIREDYLRILRFFRFHAYYADPDAGFDAEGLAACAALADGIDGLSRERVGSEMTKLLAAPDPAPSVAAMAQSGVLLHALPGADTKALPILVHLESVMGLTPNPIRRLAALGGEDPGTALRLSKKNQRYYAQLRDGVESGQSAAMLGYRRGAAEAIDILLLRAALLVQPLDRAEIATATHAAVQTCPVTASDLLQAGLSGPELGATLAQLENRWIASGFVLRKADLLQ